MRGCFTLVAVALGLATITAIQIGPLWLSLALALLTTGAILLATSWVD